MRLKKGVKEYKLPKDYSQFERCYLRRGDIQYPVGYLCNKTFQELMSSAFKFQGMPVYLTVMQREGRIVLYPSPDAAYYCTLEYLVSKRI